MKILLTQEPNKEPKCVYRQHKKMLKLMAFCPAKDGKTNIVIIEIIIIIITQSIWRA